MTIFTLQAVFTAQKFFHQITRGDLGCLIFIFPGDGVMRGLPASGGWGVDMAPSIGRPGRRRTTLRPERPRPEPLGRGRTMKSIRRPVPPGCHPTTTI